MKLDMMDVASADTMFDHAWRTLPNRDGLSRWISSDRLGEYIVLKEIEGLLVPLALFKYAPLNPAGRRHAKPFFNAYSFRHGYWKQEFVLDEFTAENVQAFLTTLCQS